MTNTRRRTWLVPIAGIALVALLAVGYVWSGLYDVGADDAHTRPVHAVLEVLRDRSIDARAGRLQVPANLNDPARMRQGAGNYDAMCTGCHLRPGMTATELSRGLNPAPPDLTKVHVDPARAFWVIKHGIKATGMPAWGGSMEDDYIWGMVALLQQLPELDAARYQALVASSGGHSHGGNESEPHGQAANIAIDAMTPEQAAVEAAAPAKSKPHAHAPGTPAHDHAPSPPGKQTADPAQPADGQDVSTEPEHEHHH